MKFVSLCKSKIIFLVSYCCKNLGILLDSLDNGFNIYVAVFFVVCAEFFFHTCEIEA